MDEKSKNDLENNKNIEKEIKIGNYIIKKTLGKGTFAKVKLALQLPKKNKVAIKIIEKKILKEEDDLIRLKREFEMLTQFNNPNVISVTEIFENYEAYFTVMEYCEGGELFNYIVENKILSEEKSAFFFYQLINGLEYIHSLGIVHRDLKPENLLLTGDLIIKIIDFGLSNYFNKKDNKLLSTPCGSPCYASPEMLSGKGYDGFKIDIWASGIILFAMLCGYLPFDHKDNYKLFEKILECKITYPKHLSDESKDLIKKILVPDPRKRITIPEIKKHKFYLKGKKIFENNYSILQLSRNDSSEDTSEEFFGKLNDSNRNNYLWYDFLHRSQNTLIDSLGVSLFNIPNNDIKSFSFEKMKSPEFNINNFMKKIKGKQKKIKEKNKQDLYLLEKIDVNREFLTPNKNNSQIYLMENIYDFCEKIINQYKIEQNSKVKHKFKINRFMEKKINNTESGESNFQNNMINKLKKKEIYLSNDFNYFTNINKENTKKINCIDIDREDKTEISERKKNINYNGLLKKKLGTSKNNTKFRNNLMDKIVRYNKKKTSLFFFIINDLLIKDRKTPKAKNLLKRLKDKAKDQNNSKFNISNLNLNITNINNNTNNTNLIKTNYYLNRIMTDSNRSNANKFTYRSPKKGKSPEHRADKPKENAVIKYYLKRFFNSIDITRKKRIIQINNNLMKKITKENMISKNINNRRIGKNKNLQDIITPRKIDLDKAYSNLTKREDKSINKINNNRKNTFTNTLDRNLKKIKSKKSNKKNINLNNHKKMESNLSKNKENSSVEHPLKYINYFDLSCNCDKQDKFLNFYLDMNNSAENIKTDAILKKYERSKKKLNLNLRNISQFIINKNNFYLNNNIINYTDRFAKNKLNIKKIHNLQQPKLYKQQNIKTNILKLKKKELFGKKNTQKNEKILPFNCEKAIQTQRNKIHNNKGISLHNRKILSYHKASHSKGKNSTKLDSINVGNINSNQILPSNKIKIKNINFDNFRNRKFLKNNNNKNNKTQMDQNEVFNLINDNIKYNNPLLNMKKFLSKINSIDFNQKSLFSPNYENDESHLNKTNAFTNKKLSDNIKIQINKNDIGFNTINSKFCDDKFKINSKFALRINKTYNAKNKKLSIKNKTIKNDKAKKEKNKNQLINNAKIREKKINNKNNNKQQKISNAKLIHLKNNQYNTIDTERNTIKNGNYNNTQCSQNESLKTTRNKKNIHLKDKNLEINRKKLLLRLENV